MLRAVWWMVFGVVGWNSVASGAIITTTFSNAEGFVTEAPGPVTLFSSGGLFSATFSGGLQTQVFDGPSYNDGPDAYLFINGPFTGSFGRTVPGSTDVGTITFNMGVEEVSFFAADRAVGTPSLRILDTAGNVLISQLITGTSNRTADGATPFLFTRSALGAAIGSIEFDNAGPAGRPPYVIALDSFSATAVPEPSSGLMVLTLVGSANVSSAPCITCPNAGKPAAFRPEHFHFLYACPHPARVAE